MKNCAYCGRKNSDDAANCFECGTPFDSAQLVSNPFSRPISRQLKWGLYFFAWGVVILATLARNPADLLAFPGFPIGLTAMFGTEAAILVAWLVGPAAITAGWVITAC